MNEIYNDHRAAVHKIELRAIVAEQERDDLKTLLAKTRVELSRLKESVEFEDRETLVKRAEVAESLIQSWIRYASKCQNKERGGGVLMCATELQTELHSALTSEKKGGGV